jgi:hypothetical protein
VGPVKVLVGEEHVLVTVGVDGTLRFYGSGVNLVVSFDTFKDSLDFAAEAQEAARWRYDVEVREQAAEVVRVDGFDAFSMWQSANADARRIECEQGPA